MSCVVTLKDGREVNVLGEATYVYDPNYGADADGNRGMPMWFRDDSDITEVSLVETDASVALKDLSKEDQDLIWKEFEDTEPPESSFYD